MSRNDIQFFLDGLKKRERWLTEEISNGGNFEHLNARRAECAYIRERLAALCEGDTR